MNHLILTARLDISDSIRSRWFLVYTLIFGALVVGLFVSGVTESRVMGFTGLSRLLVTYLQITMAVLPLFVLLTTVRSVAGDRESGAFEYLLSLPVGTVAWFWGKILGRFVVVLAPVLLAMAGAVVWALVMGIEVPWSQVAYYTGFLVSLGACFLGAGMLLSALARSTDVATGAALLTWLLLLLFMDLVLLGILIKSGVGSEAIIAIALANPLQVFRTAAMMLFDPQLVLLGVSAYVILDHFGHFGFVIWALVYPLGLGVLFSLAGYLLFRRGDYI